MAKIAIGMMWTRSPFEVLATSYNAGAVPATPQSAAPAALAVFALERPRPELCTRIDARVKGMFANGLVAEIRALLAGERPPSPVAAQGVGYREVLDHLAGRATLDETIARVQVRSRQFAKRQATWFRGLVEVHPWPVATGEPPEATAERLAAAIEKLIASGTAN